MGLEEHLLTMFREDFEFHGDAAPSHLGAAESPGANSVSVGALLAWAPDAQAELGKIPFFVRGKARRNAERFAAENHLAVITLETLYDAKAHFGR
jgi:light-independent protochlorophyllide reductase subunit B